MRVDIEDKGESIQRETAFFVEGAWFFAKHVKVPVRFLYFMIEWRSS